MSTTTTHASSGAGEGESEPKWPVQILYTNWRNETAVRRINLRTMGWAGSKVGLWYGSTEWHPEPQWLLHAHDLDKGDRDFALSGIKAWGKEAVAAALATSPSPPTDLAARFEAKREECQNISRVSFSDGIMALADYHTGRARAFAEARDMARAGAAGGAGIEWQSLETAPKDGTHLWLFYPARTPGDQQMVGWWDADAPEGEPRWMDHADAMLIEPTHWRPLPAPPPPAQQGSSSPPLTAERVDLSTSPSSNESEV